MPGRRDCGRRRRRRGRGAVGAGRAERAGRRGARAAGVEPGQRVARADGGAGAPARARPPASTWRRAGLAEELLGPVRDWLGSAAARARSRAATRVRAEVPILLGAGGTVLRGSIDLLVERDGAPPLVVDYKTDRSTARTRRPRRPLRDPAGDLRPRRRRGLGADEVEVAYVFLERADAPSRTVLTRPTWTPARPASMPPSRRSAPASSRRPRSRAHLGPLPRLPRPRPPLPETRAPR